MRRPARRGRCGSRGTIPRSGLLLGLATAWRRCAAARISASQPRSPAAIAARSATLSIHARVFVTSSRFSIDTGATRKPRCPSAVTRSSELSLDSARAAAWRRARTSRAASRPSSSGQAAAWRTGCRRAADGRPAREGSPAGAGARGSDFQRHPMGASKISIFSSIAYFFRRPQASRPADPLVVARGRLVSVDADQPASTTTGPSTVSSVK